MEEPIRWRSGEGKAVYCAPYSSKVAVGDGGENAIDCWGALNPEKGRQERGKEQCWGMEPLEGGGPTAPG